MTIQTLFNLHDTVTIMCDGIPITGEITHISIHIDEKPSIAYWVKINHPTYKFKTLTEQELLLWNNPPTPTA